MRKPNWNEWNYTPDVIAWQAAALSMDFDPNNMKEEPDSWTNGPYRELSFLYYTGDGESCPSNSDADEFALRLRVLVSNLPKFATASKNKIPAGNNTLSMSDFAAWAVHVVRWNNLPPELVALAQKAGLDIAGADEEPTSAGVETTDADTTNPWMTPNDADPQPVQSWYTPARYFARELVRADTSLLGKRDILCQKIGERLTQVGIKKRGGVLSFEPSTILKALTNIKLG